MAAEDKNTPLLFLHWWGRPKNHKSEYDVDIYAIIFLTLAVVIYLHLSVLGLRTHQRRRIPVTGILLTFTAAALGAVFFDVGGAKRYPGARLLRPRLLRRPSAAPPALSMAIPACRELANQKVVAEPDRRGRIVDHLSDVASGIFASYFDC